VDVRNEETLAVPKDIVLCEALIDALKCWTAGIRKVTASYGVNGCTPEHRVNCRFATAHPPLLFTKPS
jgi:DNA primase